MKDSDEKIKTKAIRNGLKCPQCNKELYDTKPGELLCSLPAKKNVHCDCGYTGYALA